MAKIKIIEGIVVLTSSIKLDDLAKVEKHNRDLLCLKDEEDGEVIETFRISTGTVGNINKYGATFGTADREGYAKLAFALPGAIEDEKAYVKETYGSAILKLRDLEDTINTSLEAINAQIDALDDIFDIDEEEGE